MNNLYQLMIFFSRQQKTHDPLLSGIWQVMYWARLTGVLEKDWQQRWDYRPALVETYIAFGDRDTGMGKDS